MGRTPCCEKAHTNKGAWTKEEDERLIAYITKNGDGSWRSLPKAAGLVRCGKSCRLRWINYLRPGLKRGNFTDEEDELIIKLHSEMGNKWSLIAGKLPGRTDNEIKNYWNTHIRRILMNRGVDPATHRPLREIAAAASRALAISSGKRRSGGTKLLGSGAPQPEVSSGDSSSSSSVCSEEHQPSVRRKEEEEEEKQQKRYVCPDLNLAVPPLEEDIEGEEERDLPHSCGLVGLSKVYCNKCRVTLDLNAGILGHRSHETTYF